MAFYSPSLAEIQRKTELLYETVVHGLAPVTEQMHSIIPNSRAGFA